MTVVYKTSLGIKRNHLQKLYWLGNWGLGARYYNPANQFLVTFNPPRQSCISEKDKEGLQFRDCICLSILGKWSTDLR